MQTVGEAEDGKNQNRFLTEYSLFLFAKPFNGNIDELLKTNYEADQYNVSEQEREEIRTALKNAFKMSDYLIPAKP